MKIESAKYTQQELNFFNEVVNFNIDGVAEVSEELGKKIVEGFPNLIWEEGKKPVVKVEKVEDNVSNEEVLLLRSEVEKQKDIVKQKNKEIAKLTESEKVWRETCEKAIKVLEKNGLSLDNEIENVVVEEKKEEGGLKEALEEMDIKQVKAFAKENGIGDVEKIKNMSKNHVIELILKSDVDA